MKGSKTAPDQTIRAIFSLRMRRKDEKILRRVGRLGEQDGGGDRWRAGQQLREVLACFSVFWWEIFIVYITPWIINLLLYSYMLYFTLFRNFVNFVHHYILSTSNSSWHIVKCLVNTGLMNKWPRWGNGCWNWEERTIRKDNQQDKAQRGTEVLQQGGSSLEDCSQVLVWWSEWMVMLSKKITDGEEQVLWTS